MDFHLVCSACDGATRTGVATAGKTVSCEHCHQSLAVPPEKIGPNTIVGDRVRLLRPIGHGGFADVWLGEQLGTSRKVAVKLLRLALNDHNVRRFRTEIELIASLEHPVLVPALDAGEDEGLHYLIMPLISGLNLQQHVAEHGPMKETDALEVVAQVADVMDMVWQKQRLVHRDLKPSNIMRTDTGATKLLDLGIARTAGQETLTASNALFGTLATMSPEQINNPREVDCRSDMYSLGCTLYFLLTGSYPFGEAQGLALQTAHVQTSPADPRTRRADISESTAHLIAELLQKQRSARPLDWATLKQRLGFESTYRLPAVAAPRRTGVSGVTGRRARYAGLGLGLTLLAALGFSTVFRSSPPAAAPRGGGSQDLQAFALEPSRRVSPDLSHLAPAQLPAQITFIITNRPGHVDGERVHLAMNLVRPGPFIMGRTARERNQLADPVGLVSRQHPVQITKPFYLAVTELTLDQFCHLKPYPLPAAGTGRLPAYELVWEDISDDRFDTITKSAMRRFGALLPAGYEFRLPTEAEWEYACRAGGSRAFPFGNDPEALGHYGWFDQAETAPVAQLKPNAWGFYDMHGNIAEWVLDGYIPYPDSDNQRVDPFHSGDGRLGSHHRLRMVRGGSFRSSSPWQCSSGHRQPFVSDRRVDHVGFRFALAPRIDKKR